MEKPSVTLTYSTGCVVGMICVGMAAFMLFMNCIHENFTDDPVYFRVAVGLLAVLAVLSFAMARSSQTLDEHGIRIKTPIFTKQFPWSDVKRVDLLVHRGRNGARYPSLTLDISGWLPGWPVDYTKRVMTCIRYYYGEPDLDKWGKPPEIT